MIIDMIIFIHVVLVVFKQKQYQIIYLWMMLAYDFFLIRSKNILY